MKYLFILLFFGWSMHTNAKTDLCDFKIDDALQVIGKSPRYFHGMPSELMNIREFIILKICSPMKYKEYVTYIEGNPKNDLNIALIYSMQSLKGEKYLKFIESMGRAVTEKGMSPDLLSVAIFPGYDWNTHLVENFDDPSVIKVIEELKVLLPKHKSDFEAILNSEALRSLISSRIDQKVMLNNI